MMVVKVVLFYFIWATITEAAPAVDVRYMKLVQSWPPSVCDVLNCTTFDCPERFTIHGLWPEERYCNGKPFDYTKIRRLVSKLNKSWIGLVRTPNKDFWRYEWDKHGRYTCFGIFDYFNLTLMEYGKYDLKAALAKKNITAGKNSTAEKISDAIKAKTGFVPTVVCKKGRTRGQVLFEVFLCYNYNNTATVLQDCTDQPHRCNPKKPVELVKKTSKTCNKPVTKDDICNPDKPVELVKKTSKTCNKPVTKDDICNPDKPVEFVQKIPQTDNKPVTKDEICNPDKPVEFVQKIPQTGNKPVRKDEIYNPDKPVEFVQKIPQTGNKPVTKDEL